MAPVEHPRWAAKIYSATATRANRRLLTTGYTPDWQPLK
jgi:hypothetical protein